MQGLMQSYPLTLTHVFRRAERLFPEKEIATVEGDGIVRIAYGEWAERTRRLAGVLDALEISADARVGTFAWNTARHLELYFAAPCGGRVLHTLNIRLFPDDVVYIADHAEDEIVFGDRSLLKLFWPLVDRFETVKHIVVMDDEGDNEVPDDPRVHDYEDLLAKAEPVDFPVISDENQAAAMCYTSGTTGHEVAQRGLPREGRAADPAGLGDDRDVATISPSGYVRLVDRTKDLVKSGGEWISSVELENAIMAHPKVAEAAVIGIPDEKWSERPLACVVPEGDEEIIDEVPKTSVGKFSKKTLPEQFAERQATA